RVLFGSDVSRITPAQGAELAYAAANLAQGGPGFLDRLRNIFGLDRLSLGGSQATNTGTEGEDARRDTGAASAIPTGSGGKYIAPGVYVGVEQGASAQSTRARVEIDVTPHISAYSSVGAESSSSVGVDWRYDY